jgi:Lar family restriction alleviation protein
MNELKPCPFCGNIDIKIHAPYFTENRYVMVQCYSCNCSTAVYKTVDQAVEAWNRRTKEEDINE